MLQTNTINNRNKPVIPETSVKIFISYAHEDTKLKNKLVNTYLQVIKLHYGGLVVWHDPQIKPGSSWDKVIKKNIREADVVLFLVTQHFMASSYIKQIEMQEALKRFNEKKQIIVPLYLQNCPKEVLPFKDKQYLPGAIPLDEYPKVNRGWVKIQDGLLQLIKDINDGKTEEYFL